MSDERTPLLQSRSYQRDEDSNDPHEQFCALVGVPSSGLQPGAKDVPPRPTSLYRRATKERHSQNITYMLTASLSNTLLLTQVILGATLTALGASESSHVLITIFGVVNTVIAGVVAYLKSRGQPMRARMYRDDMDRVVDEIENSEVMWLGISRGVLGYAEISADGDVTVRSEVARLTRLYDRAVKTNTMNNPDIYTAGGAFDGSQGGSGVRPLPPAQPIAPVVAVPDPPPATVPATVVAPVAAPDPDESPATKAKPTPTPPPPPPPPAKEASGEGPQVNKKDSSATANQQADHVDASLSDAPEKLKGSSSDTPKDSTQPGSGADTTNTTANPAATSDDILDDPSNPTIHSESKKPASNGTSK